MKTVSAQCMYEIKATISTPGCVGGNAPIYASAINDHGVVVGHFIDCAFNEMPFMWSEETGFVAIPLPEGVLTAEPMDVNNNGEIVGSLFRPGVGTRAFRYHNGVWDELPPLPGYPIARANAINDDDLIVGEAFDPNALVEPFHAVMWQDGSITQLQLPVGPNTYAEDVNDESVIVGLMGDAITTTSLGFLQFEGMTVEIPPVSNGDSCEARAVNNRNVVTGRTRFKVKSGPAPSRSWILENGVLTDLGTLPGAEHRVVANDINDAGQIVGQSLGTENATDKSFLWQNGGLFDLRMLIDDLPPDVFLMQQAYAVNNRGDIVVDDSNNVRLLVLSPASRPLGDVTIDCTVDSLDVIAVLSDWGPDKGGRPTDIVTSSTFQPPGDGVVDGADLAVVLGNWNGFNSQSLPKRR